MEVEELSFQKKRRKPLVEKPSLTQRHRTPLLRVSLFGIPAYTRAMEFKLPPQVSEITVPTACIVRFNTELGARPVYYEVIVDPRQTSPSGRMIRMDAKRGCEIHGWQPIDSIAVEEVLREFTFEDFDRACSAQAQLQAQSSPGVSK